jgi:hypothetical protein
MSSPVKRFNQLPAYKNLPRSMGFNLDDKIFNRTLLVVTGEKRNIRL